MSSSSTSPAKASEVRVVVREAPEKALPFVLDSWMNSYNSMRAHPMRSTSKDRFMRGHRPFVEAILGRSTLLVAVFDEPGLENAFLGWICASSDAYHYVYVKNSHRRHGIASLLIRSAAERVGSPSFASHMTGQGMKLARSSPVRPVFSPGHAFYPPTETP